MRTAGSRPAGVRKFDPTHRQNLKKRTPVHRCTNLPPTPSKVVAVRVLCLIFFSRSHLCAPLRNVSASKKASVATCAHGFRFRPRRASWSDISATNITRTQLIRNPSCQPCYTNHVLLILISRMGPSKELDLTRNQDCIFFWDLLGEYGVLMGWKTSGSQPI